MPKFIYSTHNPTGQYVNIDRIQHVEYVNEEKLNVKFDWTNNLDTINGEDEVKQFLQGLDFAGMSPLNPKEKP